MKVTVEYEHACASKEKELDLSIKFETWESGWEHEAGSEFSVHCAALPDTWSNSGKSLGEAVRSYLEQAIRHLEDKEKEG